MITDYTIEQLETFQSVEFWLKFAKEEVARDDYITSAISTKRAEGFIKEIESFI